jgi:hypothetical protein
VAISRVPHLKDVTYSKPTASARVDEGLDAFTPEATLVAKEAAAVLEADAPALGFGWTTYAVAAAIVLVAASVAVALNRDRLMRAFTGAPPTGSLSLQTTPVGAEVTIDGEVKGITPLALTLAPGTYQVKMTSPAGQERAMSVTLKAGDSVVQQIEWAAAPAAAAATTGALVVQTDPSGQAVFIDEVRRGLSPLTISDLPAGEHRLLVSSERGNLRRAISIKAGETLSVVMAPQAAAVSAGWLKVSSPVPLQLRSDGDLIGNTDSARVMLAAGEHQIEMSNDALGFTRTQRVSVAPGRTAEVRVTLPNGLLSINAVPWAEVWLNGERLGETPLANLSRPVGNYRVTLRHPQLGERQTTVTVSLKETARVGVDMRQPR